ncbi:unnamed protein product [Amoebophrya sp. A120]|nr:unnamed protein product [Amoebophrya sp. A120]|eukprot:GSA120T00024572001.1
MTKKQKQDHEKQVIRELILEIETDTAWDAVVEHENNDPGKFLETIKTASGSIAVQRKLQQYSEMICTEAVLQIVVDVEMENGGATTSTSVAVFPGVAENENEILATDAAADHDMKAEEEGAGKNPVETRSESSEAKCIEEAEDDAKTTSTATTTTMPCYENRDVDMTAAPVDLLSTTGIATTTVAAAFEVDEDPIPELANLAISNRQTQEEGASSPPQAAGAASSSSPYEPDRPSPIPGFGAAFFHPTNRRNSHRNTYFGGPAPGYDNQEESSSSSGCSPGCSRDTLRSSQDSLRKGSRVSQLAMVDDDEPDVEDGNDDVGQQQEDQQKTADSTAAQVVHHHLHEDLLVPVVDVPEFGDTGVVVREKSDPFVSPENTSAKSATGEVVVDTSPALNKSQSDINRFFFFSPCNSNAEGGERAAASSSSTGAGGHQNVIEAPATSPTSIRNEKSDCSLLGAAAAPPPSSIEKEEPATRQDQQELDARRSFHADAAAIAEMFGEPMYEDSVMEGDTPTPVFVDARDVEQLQPMQEDEASEDAAPVEQDDGMEMEETTDADTAGDQQAAPLCLPLHPEREQEANYIPAATVSVSPLGSCGDAFFAIAATETAAAAQQLSPIQHPQDVALPPQEEEPAVLQQKTVSGRWADLCDSSPDAAVRATSSSTAGSSPLHDVQQKVYDVESLVKGPPLLPEQQFLKSLLQLFKTYPELIWYSLGDWEANRVLDMLIEKFDFVWLFIVNQLIQYHDNFVHSKPIGGGGENNEFLPGRKFSSTLQKYFNRGSSSVKGRPWEKVAVRTFLRIFWRYGNWVVKTNEAVSEPFSRAQLQTKHGLVLEKLQLLVHLYLPHLGLKRFYADEDNSGMFYKGNKGSGGRGDPRNKFLLSSRAINHQQNSAMFMYVLRYLLQKSTPINEIIESAKVFERAFARKVAAGYVSPTGAAGSSSSSPATASSAGAAAGPLSASSPTTLSVVEKSNSLQRFINDHFEIQVRDSDVRIRAIAVPEPSEKMIARVKDLVNPSSWWNFYGQNDEKVFLQRIEEQREKQGLLQQQSQTKQLREMMNNLVLADGDGAAGRATTISSSTTTTHELQPHQQQPGATGQPSLQPGPQVDESRVAKDVVMTDQQRCQPQPLLAAAVPGVGVVSQTVAPSGQRHQPPPTTSEIAFAAQIDIKSLRAAMRGRGDYDKVTEFTHGGARTLPQPDVEVLSKVFRPLAGEIVKMMFFQDKQEDKNSFAASGNAGAGTTSSPSGTTTGTSSRTKILLSNQVRHGGKSGRESSSTLLQLPLGPQQASTQQHAATSGITAMEMYDPGSMPMAMFSPVGGSFPMTAAPAVGNFGFGMMEDFYPEEGSGGGSGMKKSTRSSGNKRGGAGARGKRSKWGMSATDWTGAGWGSNWDYADWSKWYYDRYGNFYKYGPDEHEEQQIAHTVSQRSAASAFSDVSAPTDSSAVAATEGGGEETRNKKQNKNPQPSSTTATTASKKRDRNKRNKSEVLNNQLRSTSQLGDADRPQEETETTKRSLLRSHTLPAHQSAATSSSSGAAAASTGEEAALASTLASSSTEANSAGQRQRTTDATATAPASSSTSPQTVTDQVVNQEQPPEQGQAVIGTQQNKNIPYHTRNTFVEVSTPDNTGTSPMFIKELLQAPRGSSFP